MTEDLAWNGYPILYNDNYMNCSKGSPDFTTDPICLEICKLQEEMLKFDLLMFFVKIFSRWSI